MALIRRRSAAKNEENAAQENSQLQELNIQPPVQPLVNEPSEQPPAEEKPAKIIRRRLFRQNVQARRRTCKATRLAFAFRPYRA